MKEAGLPAATLVARRGVAPAAEAAVGFGAQQEEAWIEQTRHRGLEALRWTVVLASAVLAYGRSLLSSIGGFQFHATELALLAVPVVAIGLAASVARRPNAEPEIHDRYLDYIVGLLLLGLAVGGMTLLPRSLSLFFWSSRLDLLSLPIFTAGACALLCGSRALWRYRWSIGLLFLMWPFPYAIAGVDWGWASGIALVVALLVGGMRWNAGRSSNGSARWSAVGMPRPRGGLMAALLILAATLGVAAADAGLHDASGLIQADGRPILDAERQPAVAIGPWSRIAPGDPPGIPLLGPGLPRTFLYNPTAGGAAAPGNAQLIEVQVEKVGDAGVLSPSAIAARQGYRVAGASAVNLGLGVTGHVLSLSGQAAPVTVLWWDWPVRSGGGVVTQRVLVASATLTGDREGSIVTFGRALIGSMARMARGLRA